MNKKLKISVFILLTFCIKPFSSDEFYKPLNSSSELHPKKSNSSEIDNEIKEKPAEKIAYLTFDDGPIMATKNIIEVIKEEDIPVSMFFVGNQIENFRSIYETALSYKNITIGNHSYCHANGKYKQFYVNSDEVVNDIKKANEIISKDRSSTTQSHFLPTRLAGRNVFRLPFISRDDFGLDKEQTAKEWLGYEKVFKEGFYIYGWDVEWSNNAIGKPVESPMDIVNTMENVCAKNRSRLPNKVVVLMHDRMFYNRFNGKENLQTFIRLLKDNGWKFENIERYF